MLISHVCQLDQMNLVFLLDVTSLAPCLNTLLLLAHGNDDWNGDTVVCQSIFCLWLRSALTNMYQTKVRSGLCT